MKTKLLTLLGALCVTAPATFADLPDPTPFAATYDVEYKGSRVGEAVISLRVDGDEFVYQSRTEPRGLARLIRGGTLTETSRFRIADGQLVPVGFTFDDGSRKGKDDNEVTFTGAAKTATSVYRGETHTFELAPSSLDRLLFQYAMSRDLAAGRLADSYTIVDRDRVKNYRVTRLADETIETDAGSFETVAVRRQRNGSSRATIVWFAPALDWLPVRLQQLKEEKPVTQMSVKSVAGLPAGG